MSSHIVVNIYNSTFDKSYTEVSASFNIGVDFNNQYEWTPPTNYPFTLAAGASFGYDQDLDWLSANPSKIAPFDGIASPPNPGLNFSDYPDYETGLFGYDRATYEE